MKRGLPGLSHVDHVGLTVPNLDAGVKFYCNVFGGHELYRLGPFDALFDGADDSGDLALRDRHRGEELLAVHCAALSNAKVIRSAFQSTPETFEGIVKAFLRELLGFT